MPSDQAFLPIPLGFISQLLTLPVGCYRTYVISYSLTAAAMSSAQRQVQLLFLPGDLPIGCCTAMHIGVRKTFSLGQNPDAGRQHDGFTQTTYLDRHFAHMEGAVRPPAVIIGALTSSAIRLSVKIFPTLCIRYPNSTAGISSDSNGFFLPRRT
jgi:hypothetical protein